MATLREVSLEEMRTRHPAELDEIVLALRSSRSKHKNDGVEILKFRYDYSTAVYPAGHEQHSTANDRFDRTPEESAKDFLDRSNLYVTAVAGRSWFHQASVDFKDELYKHFLEAETKYLEDTKAFRSLPHAEQMGQLKDLLMAIAGSQKKGESFVAVLASADKDTKSDE